MGWRKFLADPSSSSALLIYRFSGNAPDGNTQGARFCHFVHRPVSLLPLNSSTQASSTGVRRDASRTTSLARSRTVDIPGESLNAVDCIPAVRKRIDIHYFGQLLPFNNCRPGGMNGHGRCGGCVFVCLIVQRISCFRNVLLSRVATEWMILGRNPMNRPTNLFVRIDICSVSRT